MYLTEQITGTKKIAMNYTNYDTAIKEKHGVALIGWPVKGPNDTEGPPFAPPSTITSVALARLLRDSLNNGVCRWKKLSRAEVTQFSQELAEKRAAGEHVGKTRKKRSDAGKKRKRGARDSDEDEDEDGGESGTDNEVTRKKAKTKTNKRKEETEEERRVRKGRADAAQKAKEAEKAVDKAQAALRAAKKAAKKEAGNKRQGKHIRASFAPKSKQVIEDDDDEDDDDDTGSDDDE